jgi:hypothetical protein
VFVPFVLPEAFCTSGIGKPIDLHVRQEVVLACSFEDLRNVVVLRGVVAELVVCAIAKIGPIGRSVNRFLGIGLKYECGGKIVIGANKFRNKRCYQRPCSVQLSIGPTAG